MSPKFLDRHPYQRTLSFSGYTWGVKASTSPVGPGPNYFSNRESDVFVDSRGRLHLKIVQHEGHWYSTEIVNIQSLGYGTYTFTLASRVDQLDPQVVLGLFTWDDFAPQFNYREIDIEFSRWGSPDNRNAQYVVQPYDSLGNIFRFTASLPGSTSTHLFEWHKEQIIFHSFQGNGNGENIQSWSYTGKDNPPPGQENVRLNLWLMDGHAPADGKEVEVVIEAFHFSHTH